MTNGYYDDDYEDDYYEDDFDDGPRIIYDAPIRKSKMIRSPSAERTNLVNLGNRVVLESASTGWPVLQESEWYDSSGELRILGLKRLLTVRPTDLMSKAPGSWVLSLASNILEGNDRSVEYPNKSLSTLPLVARITFGTGGVSTWFDVDATKSLLAIPSNDFIVEVGWRPVLSNTSPADQTDIRLPSIIPNKTEVIGTIHRSLETGESIPTISYIIPNTGEVTRGDVGGTLTIPPQAVSWGLSTPAITPLGAAIGDARLQNSFVGGSIPSARLDELDSAQLVNMIRGGCFRPIPALATALNYDLDLSALSGPFGVPDYALITFRLGV